MWSLESDLDWERPLDEHLGQICDAIEDKPGQLQRLTQAGYRMDLFCFVEVQNGHWGVLLGPGILRRLAKIPIEVDLDIYASSDDEDE